MKAIISRSSRGSARAWCVWGPARQPRWLSRILPDNAAGLGFALVLAGVGWASDLFAADAVVKTLAGGPSQSNPHPYGYADGNSQSIAQFNFPSGLALDPSGSLLFVADYTNDAVRVLSSLGDPSSGLTTTFAGATNGINHPVAVAVDGATNVYVLNRGNGTNGTVLEFNGAYYANYGFAFPAGTNASRLTNATAMVLDGLTNLYVTVQDNTVVRIQRTGSLNVVGVITNAGTALRGITVLDDGQLALSDSGNNGIWVLNPATGQASQLTGFHGVGDVGGPPAIAAFDGPEMIGKAGGGMLVVADRGNHKVKTIDALGNVTRLYGVSSNYWVQGSASQGIYPGWYDGTVCTVDAMGCPEAREPLGVVVASDGSVYTTEVYYHIIRHTTATGLTGPQPGYPPFFASPEGVALDSSSTHLYIADPMNNAVQVLDLTNNQTTTFLNAANGLARPVAVAVDATNNLYVLNQGSGANGSVLQFDAFGNPMATNVTGLALPTALTLDGYGNLLVAGQGGTVWQFGAGLSNTLATVANAQLQGVALFDDGTVAVSDAANHVIWEINPITKAVSLLSGASGQAGSTLGSSNHARLNAPHQLARAANGLLVVADYGNNRLVTVDRLGSVTNVLNSTNAQVWYGSPGDPYANGSTRFVQMLSPVGVTVGSGGTVYASEAVYDDIRGLQGTGLAQPTSEPFDGPPFFKGPEGVASDSSSTHLYIADPMNNAVQVLDLANNQTTTFLNATNGMNRPVDVLVDASDNLYVLNQGHGTDGSILEFNRFGNQVSNLLSGLILPNAFAVDASGNFLVAQKGGVVISDSPVVIASITTNPAVQLEGIAVFDDGTIAVSDATNHVIWQVNPNTKQVSLFTGQFGTPGATLGSSQFAQLSQPGRLGRVGGDLLLVADSGNNRLVVVDRSGAITNVLDSTNAVVWFGRPGDPHGTSDAQFVPMVFPIGVVVSSGGAVYASEAGYDDIRELLAAGLSPAPPLGTGGGTPTSTNTVVSVPVLDTNANWGYYPMGRWISVASAVPNVRYTTDGSEPSLSSMPAVTVPNVGLMIPWFNPTNDLTGLRVKAFLGTNASDTVTGQPASTNTIGIPAPTADGVIPAGVGSTVVVPVVVDLTPNSQIMSFEFRVEISPGEGSPPPITNGFRTLVVSSNDFVPLFTAAQGNSTLNLSGQSYRFGLTNGLAISTANQGSFLFQKFAVVALLAIPIPANASVGSAYSLSVSYPSATSDGSQAAVDLTSMPPATIRVTNIAYIVGDSASSPLCGWYNAGGFGDGKIDDSDVNNAFYAALGLRVPYAFSDLFNAMDAYPPDAPGFVGGDGQILFLDWQLILQRSLGLDTNNWTRFWTSGGYRTNSAIVLSPQPQVRQAQLLDSWPWYRQALVGAVSVGNAVPGSTVDVPVYVKLEDGVSLSGLQFRAVVRPQQGAPSLAEPPVLNLAAGVPTPFMTQSFQASELAAGWSLGAFDFQSRSSNFLGWVTFTVPASAQAGQGYTLSLTNVDGAPDLETPYQLESRSASVVVNGPAPPASICSDEWKLHFFGTLTDPRAADLADPDGDGMPNWMEYLAGTDPTNARSKLQFSGAEKGFTDGASQVVIHWLTAPGKTYEVQWSGEPVGGAWYVLTTVSGDGAVANCPDTTASVQTRYYRLQLIP